MKRMKLVLVGNGMAGVRTLEELLKIAPDLYDITVFGAEPHPNYNRILLSPVLAGEQTIDEIVLNPLSWYAEHGIRLQLGCKVTRLDRVKRLVHGQDGSVASYDRLLLATGSSPFILPVPGKDLAGVVAYRDIADTEAMIAAATQYQHAVVIGGGLLGLEAANGLMQRGMQVTVVHLMPWLMERQLDDVAGGLLRQSLESRGIRFEISASVCAPISKAMPRCSSERCSSRPATSSSWRSISHGMMCTTVTCMPRTASPLAASRPSRPPPITTACRCLVAAAIIACVSWMSR